MRAGAIRLQLRGSRGRGREWRRGDLRRRPSAVGCVGREGGTRSRRERVRCNLVSRAWLPESRGSGSGGRGLLTKGRNELRRRGREGRKTRHTDGSGRRCREWRVHRCERHGRRIPPSVGRRADDARRRCAASTERRRGVEWIVSACWTAEGTGERGRRSEWCGDRATLVGAGEWGRRGERRLESVLAGGSSGRGRKGGGRRLLLLWLRVRLSLSGVCSRRGRRRPGCPSVSVELAVGSLPRVLLLGPSLKLAIRVHLPRDHQHVHQEAGDECLPHPTEDGVEDHRARRFGPPVAGARKGRGRPEKRKCAAGDARWQ